MAFEQNRAYFLFSTRKPQVKINRYCTRFQAYSPEKTSVAFVLSAPAFFHVIRWIPTTVRAQPLTFGCGVNARDSHPETYPRIFFLAAAKLLGEANSVFVDDLVYRYIFRRLILLYSVIKCA